MRTSFIIYPHSVCSTVSHHILQYMICPSDVLRKGGGPAPNPVVPLLIGDVDTTPLKDKKNTLQPELWKCWDIVFFLVFWIKWKLKDFQITWANILFTIEHREHNVFKLMFKLRNVTLLSTKWAHFKFDACYRSQKSWHGGNKGLKKQDILKWFSWENI